MEICAHFRHLADFLESPSLLITVWQMCFRVLLGDESDVAFKVFISMIVNYKYIPETTNLRGVEVGSAKNAYLGCAGVKPKKA